MIDFFTRAWAPGSVPNSWYREAYLGCAHIWPAERPYGQWRWWTEHGDDLVTVASGYTDDLCEAKTVASAAFLALAALRPDDGPRTLPLRAAETAPSPGQYQRFRQWVAERRAVARDA